MEAALLATLGTLPNLAIAIWCIRQYQETIRILLENQQRLVDQLMALHPPQTKEDARNIVFDSPRDE